MNGKKEFIVVVNYVTYVRKWTLMIFNRFYLCGHQFAIITHFLAKTMGLMYIFKFLNMAVHFLHAINLFDVIIHYQHLIIFFSWIVFCFYLKIIKFKLKKLQIFYHLSKLFEVQVRHKTGHNRYFKQPSPLIYNQYKST